MINEAHISLSGYVATQPFVRETRTGVPSIRMRVAWTPRRQDPASGEWTDLATSFCTVTAYRRLAENAAACLRKGDPVVIRGRVTVREYEDRGGQQRREMEVDAISFGHDLSRGVAVFHRVRPQTGMTANEYLESGTGDAADAAIPAGAGVFGAAGPEMTEGADVASVAGEMFDEAAAAALAGQPAEVPVPS
jgi:single-strand DNA-binding protein